MTKQPTGDTGGGLPEPFADEPVERLEHLVTWLAEGPVRDGLSRRQVRSLRDQLVAILYDLRRQGRWKEESLPVPPAAPEVGVASSLDTGTVAEEEVRRELDSSDAGDGGTEADGWQDEYDKASELERLAVEAQVKRIYSLFVEYFGGFEHQLSRHEAEQLRVWLRECPHALVFMAILRAVNRGRINLRYVDRILFNWSKQGVRTVDDVREHDADFRARRGGGEGGEQEGGKTRRHTNGRLGQHPGTAGREYEDEDLW